MKKILEKLIEVKSFETKLGHNFHEFTFLEKVYYFLYYRSKMTKEEQFFFEGAFLVPGQMYKEERKGLYDTIVKYKPNHCFEIGTADGGGSTYFIASAFKKNGSGKIYTLESYSYLYKKTKRKYNMYLRALLPHVTFIFGNSTKSFEPYLTDEVQCLFLDGSDDPQETLDQYNNFYPRLKSGSILMIHDWNTKKTVTIKPVILADTNWEKIFELTEPVSVGLVVFKRK